MGRRIFIYTATTSREATPGYPRQRRGSREVMTLFGNLKYELQRLYPFPPLLYDPYFVFRVLGDKGGREPEIPTRVVPRNGRDEALLYEILGNVLGRLENNSLCRAFRGLNV